MYETVGIRGSNKKRLIKVNFVKKSLIFFYGVGSFIMIIGYILFSWANEEIITPYGTVILASQNYSYVGLIGMTLLVLGILICLVSFLISVWRMKE